MSCSRGTVLRLAFLSKILSVILFAFLVFTPAIADVTKDDTLHFLPDKVGDFHAIQKELITPSEGVPDNDYERNYLVTRSFRSTKGEDFVVTLVQTRSDRGAYSVYSNEIQRLLSDAVNVDGVGTVAVSDSSGRLLFYKGMTFVSITDESHVKNHDRLIAFAQLLAEPIDKGEGDVPVLLKHLPDWETKQQRAFYAISLSTLQEAAGQRLALDAVNFSGGAEAVTANYGSSRLVIVELSTPQLATENDARINTRINELRISGQPIPSAYRRVGNYVVFVFDAPDEATATQLIDKISYEQVVQWLGDNPNWLIRAEREYRRTTGGVILAVFKASGLSILLCLVVGGIFGSIVFRRRRRQQSSAQAYSDAGGMLRLNIDEMTPEVDASRLLSKGDG